MLYQRLHRDVAHGIEVSRGGSVANFGQYYGTSANAWLFPLLLKYKFGKGPIAPIVHAGATLRHAGVFTGTGVELDFNLMPVPTSFRIDSGRGLDVAETFGAGVAGRLGRFEISPEIRFLHWTSAYDQPVQNQALLLIGISFPARR